MIKTSKVFFSFLLIIAFLISTLGFSVVPLQSIKLNVGNLLLKANRTYSLKVTLTPLNTTQKSLVYSTSNKNVATVDKSGVIKGIGAGKATIYVKSAFNSKIYTKCTVTVTAVKKINLRYWVVNPQPQYISTLNENEVFQEMEKLTGVHMSFTHPSQTALTEQFNLMIASRNLPDIIGVYGGGTFFQQGLDKAIQDNIILDLKPYLGKDAPNYKKMLDSDKELYRKIATNSGKIASLHSVPVVKDPVWYAPNLNKNWLDELNLKLPVTMDDWYTMLKAFKSVKKAESPLISINTWGASPINSFGIFLSAYGIGPSFYPLKDSKKLAYGPIQPQMKDYLITINKWYKEGLIDKDFVTLTGDQVNAKWTSQKTGAMLHAVEIAYPMAQTGNFEMTVAPYPVLKNGDRNSFLPDLNSIESETVITTTNKYVSDTLKWFDYAYSDKGAMLFNYGIEGKSYTMVNGKAKFTDYMMKNPKYPLPVPINILKLHAFPQKYFNSQSSPQVNETTLNMRKVVVANADISQTLPPIKIAAEDGAENARIMGQVNVYQNEMLFKFILGIEPIEKFDQYVEQMKKLGIEDALKIRQKAYDLYMNK